MATLFRGKYRVESARLRGWDYASDASYFVTICTKNKQHFFGKIIDGKMRLNALGEIANQCWLEIPRHFKDTQLDEFIIMPNHVHGILILHNRRDVALQRLVCCENQCVDGDVAVQRLYNGKHENMSKISPQPKALSTIIRSFKSIATKTIHQRYPQSHFSWQPGFYDHIIRSERSWFFIREYISNNPANWATDEWFQHVPDSVLPA